MLGNLSAFLLTLSRIPNSPIFFSFQLCIYRDKEFEYSENVRMNRVPVAWEAISWESTSLSGWVQGLIARHEQLHRWLTSGRPNSFWLTGFLNPQGFLTAVKQEVMRHHAKEGWALDDVVLKSDVTRFTSANSIRESLPAGSGVYIHGLFLEGCIWSVNEGKLKDPQPRKLFSSLPVVRITAVLAKDANEGSGYYYAPCYKAKRRTQANFITKLRLKTEEAPARWVLRGAAVLCDVD